MPPLKDLESKRCFGHRTNVTAVAWNLDGSRLLSAGDASTILIYDTARLQASVAPERRFLYECHGHNKNIEAVVASKTSPDMFVTGGVDCMFNVFDTRVGTHPIQTRSTGAKCLFADWAPDGNTFAVGLSNNTVCFVDCLTWEIKKKMPFDGEVNQFRWTADGKRILFTRGDGSVDVHEWPSLNHMISFKGNVNTCMGIACDPKGRYVAVTSLDTCVSVWDSVSLSNIFTIDRWEMPVQQAEYSFNGEYLALIGDYERIDITESVTGTLVHSIATISLLNNMAWHPSSLLLAYSPIKSIRERYNNAPPEPATFVWGFPRSK